MKYLFDMEMPHRLTRSEKKKCIVLTSGGLDSQVSIGLLNNKGYEIEAIFFDYKQNTKEKELFAAKKYCKDILNKEPKVIDIFSYMELVKNTWSGGGKVPDKDSKHTTIFIPGRNIIFLLYSSIVGYYQDIYNLVLSLNKSDVVSGDCKKDFCLSFEKSLSLGMSVKEKKTKYRILTPLSKLTKSEVIRVGADLNLNLRDSWSCYDNKEKQCGICYNCTKRKEAFKKAKVQDLTEYLQ